MAYCIFKLVIIVTVIVHELEQQYRHHPIHVGSFHFGVVLICWAEHRDSEVWVESTSALCIQQTPQASLATRVGAETKFDLNNAFRAAVQFAQPRSFEHSEDGAE